MNKKIFLTLAFVLTVALSVGAIYASDANVTDSCAADLQDEIPVALEDVSSQEVSVSESGVDNDSSNDVLNSEDSSTLSTNMEDSNVLASGDNASSKVDVSKTVTSKDVTKYYKGSTKYSAKFLDANGSLLTKTKVKITVNGKTYTKTTDNNGMASLDVNLKPGTYKVVAKNPVTGYSLTTTFKILSTISASDMTKVYADSKKFSAKFFKSNGKALANKKVKFKINGKKYTKKTNKNGVASLSLTTLKKGTYKIISYNSDGLTKTNKVKVVKSASTSLSTYTYTFLIKDTKKIKARLLDKYGHPLKGKKVKFKVNGKTYTDKTSTKGYATVKLSSLKAGTYTVKCSFAKTGSYKASSAKGKVSVLPSKNPTFTVKSTTTFGHGAGTHFKVALTSGNVPIADKKVKFTVNGTSYEKTTNSKGIASLPINLGIGNYTVNYSVKSDSKINSKSGSTPVKVVERKVTSINWKSSTSFYQGTQSSKLLVLGADNKPLSGVTVKLTVNSKTYTATTSSDGYATISASFPSGNYNVSYTFVGNNLNAPSSGLTNLNVLKIPKISIKNIVKGASTIKSYYASHKNLPNTVTAGGITFTMPEFLYLMSQAISQLSNSKTNDITIIYGVSAPSSPSGDSINADLVKAKYVTVAKNAASFISKNKAAPNYASSAVGKIVYKELVDAESRILSFYGSNNRLPNYVTISTSSGSTGTGLNEKNTEKDLSAYLKKSTNCEVGNSAISKIVKSLTSGLTSTSAKAKAIFNYVRDTVSYSFYYNTKYGAAGTLSAKKGNCVDHSHLLVAMYRTAGIPARYVHGKCTFTSGSTYGHVWCQVLIGGKWTVADATSSRNSLGNVANWNTKSFTLNKIYASLPF